MEIKIHTGESILAYTNTLAEWRIKYFKEFPYLYEGNIEYESTYVNNYVIGKDSILVTVELDNIIIAIASGIALKSEFEIVSTSQEKLKQIVNIDKCAYLGEIIIDKKHRGKGVAKLIFEAYENYFHQLGYSHNCFLTVVRKNHPLEPQNYVNPSIYWNSIGYHKTEISSFYNWPTIQQNGTVIEMENEMVYWIKNI